MYFACRKAAEVSNSSMTTSVRPFALQCLNFLTWWIKIIKPLCILKHSTSECWEALEWIPNSSSRKKQSMWSMKEHKDKNWCHYFCSNSLFNNFKKLYLKWKIQTKERNVSPSFFSSSTPDTLWQFLFFCYSLGE